MNNEQIAISIEDVSKLYRFLPEQSARTTLREDVRHTGLSILGLTGLISYSRKLRELWAVKNVSFTVRKGRVMAIIGRNGSGKSTLLKIISGITRPTAGKVTLHGRIASLLEIGTGFHPELSGKENIFLNATLIGMKKAEINQSYESIVEYSGVREFINMPVKHYSSGMFVRLAFSIAVHMDPDILILDEVLAVGDAEFRVKSMDTIKSMVERKHITILIVSHDEQALRSIATDVVVMEKGECFYQGDVESSFAAYHRLTHTP